MSCNNISIGFDTFNRGIDYDGTIYACNCSTDALDSRCNSVTTTAYDMSNIKSKDDNLQNTLGILKEQLRGIKYSAKDVGAAFKNMSNRFNDNKVSLRNQLLTIIEWQTI